jgi:hypothetical protein
MVENPPYPRPSIGKIFCPGEYEGQLSKTCLSPLCPVKNYMKFIGFQKSILAINTLVDFIDDSVRLNADFTVLISPLHLDPSPPPKKRF